MHDSIFASVFFLPIKQSPVLDQAGLHHLVASGLIHIPLGVILLSEPDCTFQVALVHDHDTHYFPTKLNMLYTDWVFLSSSSPCAITVDDTSGPTNKRPNPQPFERIPC